MTQENVEIVRRGLTAAWRRPEPDLDVVNALYDPDHVLVSDWGIEGERYLGARGFRDAMADMDTTWRDWLQEIEEILDAGDDEVVVLARLVARGQASGSPASHRWALVITLRDGKIAATRAFLDPDEALEAAGLRE
jgi:ketosteroid isomerase-like protein